MSGAEAMLEAAARTVGLEGRPHFITRDYADRNGAEFLRAAWCDMSVTYWARTTGNDPAVLPAGDRAYTVWPAEDFRKADQWVPGTIDGCDRARPGWIVFFDWGGANTVAAIDHVGIVVRSLGEGRVETIEGNTGDACRRRIRSAAVIAGFGVPAYTTDNWTEDLVNELPLLKKGDGKGERAHLREHVETLQALLIARSHPEVELTGVFDGPTDKALRAVQKWGKVEVDGEVGPQTWPVLLRVA